MTTSGKVTHSAEYRFSTDNYEKVSVRLPMRDGVELNTDVYAPKNAATPRPILLARTPYGISERGFPCATEARTIEIARSLAHLAADEYIFVMQDIRGTGQSGGDFLFLNTPHVSPQTSNESTDAWDTIDWLIQNIDGHNGRVGVTGFSYGGFTVLCALLDAHPALRAASPQSAMADCFRGDDIYFNGALILGAAAPFASLLETGKSPVFHTKDAYDFWLERDVTASLDESALGRKSDLWRAFFENNRLTDYWRRRELAHTAPTPNIPCLHVIGAYDVEDFEGPLRVFQSWRQQDKAMHRLVLGPWRHGGWVFHARGGASLGPFEFEQDMTEYFLREIEAPFFRRALIEGQNESLAPVRAYELNGSGWREFDAWPPEEIEENKELHFKGDGRLSPATPTENKLISYESDPENPVPYTERPIGFYSGKGEGHSKAQKQTARALFALECQSFLQDRSDCLVWVSDPLEQDVILCGAAVLELMLTLNVDDADIIATLIDQYPSDDVNNPNYQLTVSRTMMRCAYGDDLANPKPQKIGHSRQYQLTFQERFYRFAQGHRVLIRLQSSFFPFLASNPQNWSGSGSYSAAPQAGRVDVSIGPTQANKVRLPVLDPEN